MTHSRLKTVGSRTTFRNVDTSDNRQTQQSITVTNQPLLKIFRESF
jgi:hypothetical protein